MSEMNDYLQHRQRCCQMIVFVHTVIPFIIEEPQDVEFQETD